MNRRRYLATICASGIGSVAGCVSAPRASESDATESDSSDRGDDADSEASDSDEPAYVLENFVELDLGDRFMLKDVDIALIATETERLDPERLGLDSSARDVFVIRLLAANEGDDESALEHELFWLEGLDPRESAPDTDLSAKLERGVTGAETFLAPGEETTLEIAFPVPDDLEPQYLWAKRYYVCLV